MSDSIAFDVPVTPLEVAEALRISDPFAANIVRRLAFQHDRLLQTANSGKECSQCREVTNEPACMYCAECYGKLVKDNALLGEVDDE